MPKLLTVTTVAKTLRAFLLPYAAHFRKRGWQVDALASGADSCEECLKAFDRCHDAAFSRNPRELRNLRELCARVRKIVTEGCYDIVHVHTPVAAFVTRAALRDGLETPGSPRPKIVYTAHGFHFYKDGNPVKNAFFIMLERLAGRWTDHAITINREDYVAALAHKIATEDRLSLLPGVGLDLKRYAPRDAARHEHEIESVRANMGVAQDDELFLMAAEFNPGKRHRDALRALAKTGRSNFHLAFAGTGPLENEMRILAFSLGLSLRVHFLGQRDDIPLLMSAARATVLPSEREGLNRSAMESIALGVPVLGADARGIRDLVTGPERGTLFSVGDTGALAAAMILSVEEPWPVPPRPDPFWNIDHILKEHENIYKSVMEKPSRIRTRPRRDAI